MIQEQIAEIFQLPTALTREKLTFSEPTVAAISEWSSNFSLMQLGDTTEAVYNALYELAELQCSETLRFDLIQSLHPLIENVLVSLEKNFLNQGLFHSDRNKHIIELSTRLRTFFANIYIDIAMRSESQLKQQKISFFRFNEKRNLKTARILASYYGLEQLGLLLVQQQMLYSSPLSNQWLMTHTLYDLALKNQEQLININQLQGINRTIYNIQQAYAQVLLLEIFNTHQIRPSEIHALYQCSFDWAKMVQILPRETTLSRYIIDTRKDHPPVYNRRQHDSFKANIFLATQSLFEHINLTIQKENEYSSKNEKVYLSAPLKFHVQNVLGSSSERQHERYEYSAQLQICFSLLTAHFYLSKAKNFHETLHLNHHYDFQSETNLHANLANTQDNSIQKDLNLLDRKAKHIYQAQVLDISINGYRVRWSNQEAPHNLRTGEFILVSEHLHNKWKGGVIRWIKQSVNKSYELGLEVLAQDIFPCAVKVLTDRSGVNFHPCLLVQIQNLENTKSLLILPNLAFFKEHQTIYLRLSGQDIKVYKIKTLLITQSFIQFDFELLNDEQQSIIDQFVHEQEIESNNHQDVWEALK